MQDRIYQYEPLWGEWKVDELIGEGSFGKVYKVKRTEFGEDYFAAVKIITIPQSETEIKHGYSEGMDEQSVKTYFENFVSGLLKEIRLMSSLKGNTNIVSLEDYKITEKKDGIGWDILIRMELLKSFMDYMAEKTLSKRDIIKLGIDMCKALELCQKANIIHRDIKPDNIFVSPHNDFKLGDFGIARQIEKTTSGLSKKGTFTYMAPEVYKGEAYNSTVDIYSLGLVLYRLLNNNRTPFLPDYPAQITHTSREESLVRRISGEAFPPPINADGRLAEIVLKACSFKPIDRYENPVLMREALESIQYQVDEAPLIYPLGDKVVNNSIDYVSTNDSPKEEGITESIFGVFNGEALKADDATESIYEQNISKPIADVIENDKTESIYGIFRNEKIQDEEGMDDYTNEENNKNKINGNENSTNKAQFKSRKKIRTISAAIAGMLILGTFAYAILLNRDSIGYNGNLNHSGNISNSTVKARTDSDEKTKDKIYSNIYESKVSTQGITPTQDIKATHRLTPTNAPIQSINSTNVSTKTPTVTSTPTKTIEPTKTQGVTPTPTHEPIGNLSIGDNYGGGKIAYILQPGDLGYISGQQHGLIAATADQSRAVQWSRESNWETLVPGTRTTIGSGKSNTDKIITQNGAGTDYAAGIARAYLGGGYSDWYLPSKEELNTLYDNRVLIGGFDYTINPYYWSSSEDDYANGFYAWYQYFNYGIQANYEKFANGVRVRAVRSF